MKNMTKNQFIEFARKRGYSVSYSGKLRKFFMKRFAGMNVHALINEKV